MAERGRIRSHAGLVLVIGILLAFAATARAAPAFAHASLQTITPGDETLVPATPKEVVLRFDEAIDINLGAGIEVYGPNGSRTDRSDSTMRDLDKVVAITIDDAGPGTYTVAWRVVSEDSHVLKGSSVFHVQSRTGSVIAPQAQSVPA